MLKYCLQKWDKNKEKLREVLAGYEKIASCGYDDLITLIVENILNDEENEYPDIWDSAHITTVDDGDYQGTLLFLIPTKEYQPSESSYLMSYIGYGSCCVCDVLQGIQSHIVRGEPLTKENLDDYMSLCKDIVCNIIRPYNYGWRYKPEFERTEQ